MQSYRIFCLTITIATSVAACNKPDSIAHGPRATTNLAVRVDTSNPARGSGPSLSSNEETLKDAAPASPELLVLAEDSTTNSLSIISGPVDTTLTLGAWLDLHPADKIGVSPPVEQLEDRFCRASHAKMRIGGRTIVRSALFDIATVPAGEKAPTDTARAPREFCQLRTIWLSTAVPDSTIARAVVDTVTAKIDQLLGHHTDELKLGGGGVGAWADGRSWKGPGTTVVVANAPPFEMARAFSYGEDGPPEPTIPAKTRRVIVAAYALNSGYEDLDRLMEKSSNTKEPESTLFRDADSAMTLAALPAISKDLKTVLAYVRNPKPTDSLRNHAIDAVLLRAVKATRDVAPTLTPPRRAAALLAADITAYLSAPEFATSGPAPLRDSLEAAGFTFTTLGLDQMVSNDRPWLWQAYNLDSLGRAGHVAFVELLGSGWTTKGACADGNDQYSKIIEHGEAALNRGDADPMVHYLVGSAYKTIFDGATAAPAGEYVGRLDFGARAESARLQAISHYTAALGSLTDRDIRRQAWNRLMRLTLKRNGQQPEYICFYD